MIMAFLFQITQPEQSGILRFIIGFPAGLIQASIIFVIRAMRAQRKEVTQAQAAASASTPATRS